MNERIRELAELSGFKVNWQHADVQAIKMARFEKFAQLIVRECADICHKMAEDSDSYVVHDGDTCAEQIREHFGVEE